MPEPLHSDTHVAVVFHGLHICGAARHCLELLSHLNSVGVHTSVIAPQGGGQWADRFIETANDLLVLTESSELGHELHDFPWRGSRRIISAHYDHSIAWALAAGNQECEMYAHFHTEPEFGLYTKNVLRRAGSLCRSIFFPSAATRSSYQAMFSQQPDWWNTKVRIMPNAFPSSMQRRSSQPTRPPQDRTNRELRLGIVSRLDQDKISTVLLVETLSGLRNRVPGLKVKIAGSGLMANHVAQELRKNRLDEVVELLGWVNEIESVYDWSDVTFLPSHSETMPYAAMESVGASRPVALPALGHFVDRPNGNPLIHTFAPSSASDAIEAIMRAANRGPESWAQPWAPAGHPFDVTQWRKTVSRLYALTDDGGDQ
ncbi:glycosyltransferase family 4 protein [Streptomyces avermitilis]|uniref:glycosyltransferase family 4 protein n=1 Tax=Streptomyces avermitilis TaxID=33903 RepID=UPI0033FB9E0D